MRIEVSVILFTALVLFVSPLAVAQQDPNGDTPPGPNSFFNVALENIASYLNVCAADSVACQTTQQEQTILSGIINHLSQEKPLAFISGSERSGFFAAAGTHRLAMTGLSEGDQIYINTDELDTLDYFGAVAILTHEMGHHQGVTDTDDRVLDVLGSKIRALLLAHSEMQTLEPFYQPKIGFLLFNPPGAHVGGPSSHLLLFDSHGILNLTTTLEVSILCPQGLSRDGGLFLSQLRSEGPFDWDAFLARQDFGFRVELAAHCQSPSESYIELITLRYSVPLGPESGSNDPHWWQSTSGRLVSGLDVTAAERGVAGYTSLFSESGGLPLKVISVESHDHTLSNGSAWSVRAVVESPMYLDFETCAADFTSPEFVNYGYKPRAILDFSSCSLSSLGTNRYQLNFSFLFPTTTPSRDYALNSISLKVKDQAISLTGSPTFTEQIHVQSNSLPSAFSLVAAGITKQGPSGDQPVFLAPSIDLTRPSQFTIGKDELFALQLLIQSAAPIRKTSYLSLGISWLEASTPHVYSFAIPATDSFKDGWEPPLNGGAQVSPYPGNGNQYVFQTSLRAHASKGRAANNQMQDADFEWVWLINDDLQEFFQHLQIDVIAR